MNRVESQWPRMKVKSLKRERERRKINVYVGQETEEARGEVQMEGFATSSSTNRCPAVKKKRLYAS